MRPSVANNLLNGSAGAGIHGGGRKDTSGYFKPQ